MKYIKNFPEFQERLKNDSELQSEFKIDPIKAIQQFQQAGSIPDNAVYRMIIGFLGLSIILVVIGVVILQLCCKCGDATVPTIFTAIASGSIGALAGLLAPAPNQSSK